ncbi:MAG: calcium-binding protein, partial [Halothiobacillaceae bacterium]|nr:calcium-binding protein [Halothiobacillaceae bacterium]
INPADLTFTRNGMNLVIGISNTTDQITIQNWGYGDYYHLEQIEFADGTVWDKAHLQALYEAIPFLGTEGNDYLSGGSGNDTLIGGAGNDVLQGGQGNDIYEFNLGDGRDTIYDGDGTAGNLDTIRFGTGINPADLTFTRNGMDLVIGIANTTDQITIQNWGYGDYYHLEQIEFADGTVFGAAEIKNLAIGPVMGTEGSDTLSVWSGESGTVNGLGGNDTLNGGAGADTLIGGAGDDYLNGGQGNDIYEFNLGDGQDTIFDGDGTAGNLDTIRFGTGINPADLTFSRNGYDLMIGIAGTTDQVTIQNWGYGDAYLIEQIEFADGTLLDGAYIQSKIPAPVLLGTSADDVLALWGGESGTLEGLDGNDELMAEDGSNTFIGGTGNDYLLGGFGDDTYIFNSGDGQDVIDEDGGVDTIRFGAGISSDDVKVLAVSEEGNDGLVLSIDGTSDQILVLGWQYDPAYEIERVEFADGMVWQTADILERVVLSVVGSSYSDYLNPHQSDIWDSITTIDADIQGLEGNDWIYGDGGSDRLDGGTGDDYLTGYSAEYWYDSGSSSDILLGGDGNDSLIADETYSDIANDYLDGGAGADWISDSISNDLIIGGTGDDDLTMDAGNDVILFNRGDGFDYVESMSTLAIEQRIDTLSLGGGFAYSDLSFSRDINDLILNVGDGVGICFYDWFDTTLGNQKIIGKLQIIVESMPGYDAQSADQLLSRKIQQFDFLALANQFEAALAADPSIVDWSLEPRLVDANIGGSDSFAMGGVLAYQYGISGSLADIPDRLLRERLTSTDFGGNNQSIRLRNVAPVLAADLLAQNATQDDAFEYVIPAGTITDADNGDVLTYAATLVDGAALPTWLNFDASTQTFSGTPTNSDVESLVVIVTVTDEMGAVVSSAFNLDVVNVNDAPTVEMTLQDMLLDVGQSFSFTLPQRELLPGFMVDETDFGTADLVLPVYQQWFSGGVGNTTHTISMANGNAYVSDWDATAGNVDTVQLVDVLSSDVSVTQDIPMSGVTLTDITTGNILTLTNWNSADSNKIEQVVFADGVTWGVSDIQSRISISPSDGNDYINGAEAGKTILSLAGDDGIYAGVGNDTVLAGAGHDLIDGGGGSDILIGGSGSDEINGDWSYGDKENDFLDGGSGDDFVYGSVSNDLLIGGAGADELSGDDGSDVYLFNRGDGNDWYFQGWSDNGAEIYQGTDTVSLGWGISYEDLSFMRNGDNLILNTGNGESITFDSWFATWRDNKSISTLQIIAEAMPSYTRDSSDPLLNTRIQQFDFMALVNQFEADYAADLALPTWHLAPHLAGAHLGGSDTSAIGGDMAYLYGKNGNLDGLSETELRAELSDASFGTGSQTLTKTGTMTGSAVFSDVDIIHGDSLTYSVTLADGSALPAWLSFDALTQTFSSTPGNGDGGILNVMVTATDTGGLSASTGFTITVAGGQVNVAPVANEDSAIVLEDSAQTTIALSDLFANDTDADAGDTLSLAEFDAVTANGNMVTQDVNGNLVLTLVNDYQALAEGQTAADSFSYTISDAAGETAVATVNISITGANDAPVVGISLTSQSTLENAEFKYTLPDGAFTEIDNGDTLSLTAMLADGSALPTWLSFDAATRTFSGIPGNLDSGQLEVIVTATDTAGLSVSGNFSLTVVNVVNGSNYNDNLIGTAGADWIDGGVGNDTLTGSAGNDTIIGGTGSDVLAGGAGDDTFLINGSDTAYDRFQGGDGYDIVQGGAGDDVIRVNSFNGINTVEKIDGGAGVNTLEGTQYNDNIDLSNTELVNIASIDGGVGNDTLTGSAGNDTIIGGTGSDVLAGGAGDDTFLINGSDTAYDRFQGGDGYDTILGGAGDDVIRVNSFNGINTVEKIDGGAGVNTLEGTQYNDNIDLSNTELVNIASIDGGVGNDTLTGSAGNDTIIGGTGSDVLAGGAGDDTFLINGSDTAYDRFQGGDGYDTILGGAGDDVIRVNSFNGINTVEKIDGGAGINILSGTQYNDNIDLSNTELVNIASIDGGVGNDTLTGSAGNDTIIGGTGSDVLAGGAGDDTFLINGGDTAYDRFQGGDGYDIVQGGAGDDVIRVNSFNGINTVEKIDGGAGINILSGTQYNDNIDLSNTELVNIANIDGGVGNDTLTGGAGNDTIIGGTGSDVLNGGAGDDTFLINGSDTAYDRFQGGDGYDIVQGGAGDDVIRVNSFNGINTVEKIDGGAGVNTLEGTQYNDNIDLSNTELVNI